ncbi:MAG TPA: hypothetical protein VLJ14_11020, partial [Ktedonobacterales bacterium]|nr:hypothetical protein [Ktedonobacterales bacterium]
REARAVTLRVYTRDTSGGLIERMVGNRRTLRLGDHLHMAAVTAWASENEQPLAPGQLYAYDLFFADAAGAGDKPDDAPHLATPGVLLADPARAADVERLVYPGQSLPGFVLPAETLRGVRVFHGSCRKPHGVGHDALAALDAALAASADDAARRPQQLYLTGDQIYADDVAAALLLMLSDAGSLLLAGNRAEKLPLVGREACELPPGGRAHAVRELAHFTTHMPENHLLARADYLAMYLFAWSGTLWPDELPAPRDLEAAYPGALPTFWRDARRFVENWRIEADELRRFRDGLPAARRALANIATYMVCDDHDITDDWYLDGAWCESVLGSPLGRRVIRNGLFAYALCQAWGSDPDQFAAGNGAAFLDAVDTWRGDETDATAALIAEHLGVPDGFSGRGTLPRTPRTLRWHYTVEAPSFRTLVLDARTRRLYDSPTAAPGLLAPEAVVEQIAAHAVSSPDARRVTLVVAPTPVLGVDIIEKFQLLSLDHYAFDRESWSLNRRTYLDVLHALAALGQIVVLSGDVHYGFGATLECWRRPGDKGGGDSMSGTATIVNFTSSSLKNACAGAQKALLTVAYPHLFHLLSQGRMPPVDLFAWEGEAANAEALRTALDAVRGGAARVWWSMPRLAAILRSPSALLLPAHGWAPHAFDAEPPERVYRLRYLRDVCRPVAARPRGPLAGVEALSAVHHQEVRETVAALSGEEELGLGAVLEAARVLESSERPHPVRMALAERLLELAHGAFAGARELEQALERGVGHLLHEAVQHSELWTRAWNDGGLHIVGDTNIGEITFEAGGEDGGQLEAVQRLWWWPPDAPE